MIFARRQFSALQDRGVRVRAFYLRSRRSLVVLWREWRRFRHELAAFQPDIVHAQFGTMTAFFAGLSTHLPLVVTYRGSDLNPVPSIGRVRRWLGFFMSQVSALRAEKIVCVSEELMGRLWWCRNKATIIPSGIDTSVFFPMDRKTVRQQLGWDHASKVVVFNAGRMPRVKRLDLAEKAFERVRHANDAAQLVILDGTTPADQLPLILNAADCLLVTSDYEGSPNIVKEALACNLPIVSVDVGDIQLRLSGVTSSFIVSRDPEALAFAVLSILATCPRTNGATVIAPLTLGATSDALENVYRAIVTRGGRYR